MSEPLYTNPNIYQSDWWVADEQQFVDALEPYRGLEPSQFTPEMCAALGAVLLQEIAQLRMIARTLTLAPMLPRAPAPRRAKAEAPARALRKDSNG